MTVTVTEADHRSAAAIATGAGELLLEVRAALEDARAHPRYVKAAGDRVSHDYIVAALAEQFPDDAVLSEEGADDLSAAHRAARVDRRPARRHARVRRARRAPTGRCTSRSSSTAPSWRRRSRSRALGLTFTDDPPHPSPSPLDRPPRLVVSRSRPPAITGILQRRLGADLVPLGSAGAKAMAVVVGDVDIYAHHGGQYEWDSAAPVGVAAAAGLHVSRLDGTPLQYNRPDPWLPDLLICKQELAGQVLGIVSEYT